MAALGEFSPLVEQASVDEAYVDATGLERLFGSLEELLLRIKERVREATGGLTCSAGAAPVKFLAKICSDINKPDGMFILRPEEVDDFLATLPVGKIPGVGKRMVESLQGLGVRTVGQLRRYSLDFMLRKYGKWGGVLYERVHGRDPRGIETERAAKSESAECTFNEDTRDRDFLQRMLLAHAAERGAERVLAHLGLENGHAARDIRELRDLLEAWRDARRTAWQTTVKVITTGILAALLVGAAIKLKLMGGPQ